MIELFAAVCLIDNPITCKDVSLIYSAEALTPMQCLMQAQPQVAKWIGEHPGWQIKRYSCRPAGQFAKTWTADVSSTCAPVLLVRGTSVVTGGFFLLSGARENRLIRI